MAAACLLLAGPSGIMVASGGLGVCDGGHRLIVMKIPAWERRLFRVVDDRLLRIRMQNVLLRSGDERRSPLVVHITAR